MNADDFGLSEGINRAILSAYKNGILRSTSLMANGSAFEDAVQIAKENPGLGVGIHISLVAEPCVAPLDDVIGLADKNGLLPPSYGSFAKAYLMKKISTPAIKAEIAAQVKKILDTGIEPTHIDSHQHLHIMPGIIEAVIDAAESAKIKVIRIPNERGGVNQSALSVRGAQLWVLTHLSEIAARKAEHAGLQHASHFWGLSVSGQMNEHNLALTVSRLRDGVNEVMCHPGFSDPKTADKYQWGYKWDDEASALCSSAIIERVKDSSVKLASFADAWQN